VENALALAWSDGETGGHVVWGILGCAACGMEYPIIDGVPFLVADLRAHLGNALHLLLARDELPAPIEGLLGDAAGPGSMLDVVRQSVSSYAWDHYGDLDPEEPPGPAKPGAVVRCLEAGLAHLPQRAVRRVIDLGCGPGRTSFALAERTGALVLGVDLHVSLIRFAARVLRNGRVAYPRRRIGLVYDRRDFPVDLPEREKVDFWAADAAALPFPEDHADLAVGLNLLDCLGAPAQGLASIGRVLGDGASAILAMPYDWSAGATPVENWVGGHSQRGPHGGAAEPLLRMLLEGGAGSASGLALVAEVPDVPWHVRMHERSVMQYSSHLVVARRKPRV
jgi:SAM-dependent methyltransferase